MTWYLMSAYALTEKKRAPVSEVQKHWETNTVYAVRTHTGKKMFACSAGGGGYADVGDRVQWIKDTGNGYGYVAHNDRTLIVENIITVTPDSITGVNDIGMNESRAIYVFK